MSSNNSRATNKVLSDVDHWLPGHVHLKSRVIEVSNDGTENLWTEIDRRDNNS